MPFNYVIRRPCRDSGDRNSGRNLCSCTSCRCPISLESVVVLCGRQCNVIILVICDGRGRGYLGPMSSQPFGGGGSRGSQRCVSGAGCLEILVGRCEVAFVVGLRTIGRRPARVKRKQCTGSNTPMHRYGASLCNWLVQPCWDAELWICQQKKTPCKQGLLEGKRGMRGASSYNLVKAVIEFDRIGNSPVRTE